MNTSEVSAVQKKAAERDIGTIDTGADRLATEGMAVMEAAEDGRDLASLAKDAVDLAAEAGRCGCLAQGICGL